MHQNLHNYKKNNIDNILRNEVSNNLEVYLKVVDLSFFVIKNNNIILKQLKEILYMMRLEQQIKNRYNDELSIMIDYAELKRLYTVSKKDYAYKNFTKIQDLEVFWKESSVKNFDVYWYQNNNFNLLFIDWQLVLIQWNHYVEYNIYGLMDQFFYEDSMNWSLSAKKKILQYMVNIWNVKISFQGDDFFHITKNDFEGFSWLLFDNSTWKIIEKLWEYYFLKPKRWKSGIYYIFENRFQWGLRYINSNGIKKDIFISKTIQDYELLLNKEIKIIYKDDYWNLQEEIVTVP